MKCLRFHELSWLDRSFTTARLIFALILILIGSGIGFIALYPLMLPWVFELDVFPDITLDFVAMTLTTVPIFIFILLIIKTSNTNPLGFIISVAGRFRAKHMTQALVLASAVYATLFGAFLSMLVLTDQAQISFQNFNQLGLAAFFILIPLQAMVEEIFFHGYLFQIFGRYISNPFLVVIITAAFFTVGHLNSPLCFLSALIFSFVAGVLVVQTGGLEASIALHVLHNLLTLGIVPFLKITTINPNINNVLSLLSLICFVVYLLTVQIKIDKRYEQ